MSIWLVKLVIAKILRQTANKTTIVANLNQLLLNKRLIRVLSSMILINFIYSIFFK